jgi:riboflavin kinase/FMN adenylyltransferase
MKVHYDIDHLPLFKNAVVTIGTFDGVHTGHLQIISQLKKEAVNIGGETVIITFDPHPRMILHAEKKHPGGIKLINTLEEKIELLSKKGIDHLVVVPFTASFSEQSAEEYIRDFLVTKFHPHTIIIGYDHRFGKNRKGDYKLLESYQSEGNFMVKEIPEYVLNNLIISSTIIRKALNEGDIKTANEYLGYNYFFEGIVIEGNKLGNTIGYPTTNLQITDPNKLVPGNGVFAVKISILNQPQDIPGNSFHSPAITFLNGMMNIGIRPTIGGTMRVIEVNMFDFNQNLYGTNLRIYMHHFLRAEMKFDGLDSLKAQLAIDKIDAIKLLKSS